jgi:hypothetical protein
MGGTPEPPVAAMRQRRAALLAFAAALVAVIISTPTASAQIFDIGTHTINVQVSPITVLAVQGGAVMLNVTDANVTAGVDAMTVQDQSTRLAWGTNSSARKITAQTSLAAPLFQLRLAAVGHTRGNPAPEMLLGTSPQNLMLDIGRSLGSCTLRYTGTALASRGVGTDIHTITFTVTTQ